MCAYAYQYTPAPEGIFMFEVRLVRLSDGMTVMWSRKTMPEVRDLARIFRDYAMVQVLEQDDPASEPRWTTIGS